MVEENQKTEDQTSESTNESKETAESANETETPETNKSNDTGDAGDTGDTVKEEEVSPEKALEEKVALLEKENADLKDQLLRRAADFQNYRNRVMKEKEELSKYANASLLGDLLDSLDNFDRTVDASANATDVKSVVDGIKMINQSLVKMLEDKYGLASYGKEGDEFNPDEHEAIGRMEEDVEKETLKQVYLKGYKLNDKVIRNAKVMVSVPKA